MQRDRICGRLVNSNESSVLFVLCGLPMKSSHVRIDLGNES